MEKRQKGYFDQGLRGSLIILLSTLFASFFGYLFRLFLARYIPLSSFGLFYATLSFFMLILVFSTMGYSRAMIKYVPTFSVKKKKKKIFQTILYSYSILLALTIISAIAVFLLSEKLALNYFRDASATILIGIFCLVIIFEINIAFFKSLFESFQDMLKAGLVFMARNALSFLFLVLFFYMGFVRDATLPAYSFLASYIIVFLLFIKPALNKISPLKKKYFSFDKKLFRELTFFAIPSVFTSLAGLVIAYIDTLMITFFLNVSEVGVYNSVLPTILVLSHFAGAISIVFFPMMSEIWEKKMFSEMKQAIELVYKYILTLVIPLSTVAFLFPEIILNILFGSEYAAGGRAMMILSVGIIMISLAHINFSVLSGIGKPLEVTKAMSLAAAFNFILNLILIPKFGIEGAALTTTLSYLMMFVMSYASVRKNARMNIAFKKIFRILLLSIIFAGIINSMKSLLEINLYAEIIITLSIAFAVYGILTFKLGIIDWNIFKKKLAEHIKT